MIKQRLRYKKVYKQNWIWVTLFTVEMESCNFKNKVLEAKVRSQVKFCFKLEIESWKNEKKGLQAEVSIQVTLNQMTSKQRFTSKTELNEFAIKLNLLDLDAMVYELNNLPCL